MGVDCRAVCVIAMLTGERGDFSAELSGDNMLFGEFRWFEIDRLFREGAQAERTSNQASVFGIDSGQIFAQSRKQPVCGCSPQFFLNTP
jgi:hypothetical protein